MISLKMRKELLPLLALAALLFLFWFVSSAQSVYGDGEVLDPGEGGGGNNPPPPNTIEGYVLNARNGSYAVGINVYLYYGFYQFQNITDANGYFMFRGPFIYPNFDYFLSLNGQTN